MQIPAALYQDTQQLERPRSALVLPAAIFPLLIVVLPFLTMGAIFDLHWGWWVGGFVAALGWAVAAGFLARSPKPGASVLRLLGWCLLWCLEPFVVLPIGGVVAHTTHWVIALVPYLSASVALGAWLYLHYRSKR